MVLLKMLQGLTPNDREKIIQAIYSYADFGVSPDFMGLELAFWCEIKKMIDKQKATREKRSQSGKAGAVARWSKKPKKAKAEKPPKAEKQAPEKARFKKPSIEELQDYCKDNNLVVGCDRFYNYYEGNGWKVGRNPMKDWKATLRNWARNNEKWNGNTIEPSETKDTNKYLELL